MKLYIIAGEASGDLHGANLIRALKSRLPGCEIRAWGGDLMQEAGATLVKHYRDLAFMGFVEVLRNIRTILRNIRLCKEDIRVFGPDALVLIDYPGFNLRIAQWARANGLKVIYYISPQLWAWHSSRVKKIKRDVDDMLVILPFEQAFYQSHGVEVAYVGHPLLDVIPPAPALSDRQSDLIALLPGSRKQEIQRILPRMLEIIPDFPDFRFVIAAAAAIPESFYQPFIRQYPGVRLQYHHTYDLLRSAHAALVKSGTSTLEAALHGAPEVVCYTGSPVSYAIARRLVQVKYISLVNLIMDRPVVAELIQHELNRARLRDALRHILQPEIRQKLALDYAELRSKLGQSGASSRAADRILDAIGQ